MKRNNNQEEKLIFKPRGGIMISNDKVYSHGLEVPPGKIIFQYGLFVLGDLETDSGRKIEAMKRLPESYSIYLSTVDGNVQASMPIRLFPNPEVNTEIIVPNNFFLPYYNCHGCCFGDREFYINPFASSIDQQGSMILNKPNLEILLADEYDPVAENDDWDIGVFKNSANEIVHSVKRINGQVVSKYDLFQEDSYPDINGVDINRYGNGTFNFYVSRKNYLKHRLNPILSYST